MISAMRAITTAVALTPAVWWQHRPQWFHVWRGAGYLAGYARYIIFVNTLLTKCGRFLSL